jgi:DDE superfamily endonuclease
VSSLPALLRRQDETFLWPGFWIAGDEAYICEGRMLIQWPGRSLSQEVDCFNHWFSSAKLHLEQAFGMSIGRWGVFWRPRLTIVDKAAQIVLVCIKLHHFFVETDSADVPPPSTVDICGHTVSPDCDVHKQAKQFSTSKEEGAGRIQTKGIFDIWSSRSWSGSPWYILERSPLPPLDM